jgi:hypothetical protein
VASLKKQVELEHLSFVERARELQSSELKVIDLRFAELLQIRPTPLTYSL